MNVRLIRASGVDEFVRAATVAFAPLADVGIAHQVAQPGVLKSMPLKATAAFVRHRRKSGTQR